MFELNVKVTVEKADKTKAGKATVTHSLFLDGEEKHHDEKEFSSVLLAYLFLGDYFYDMIEELLRKNMSLGIMEQLLEMMQQATPKPELN